MRSVSIITVLKDSAPILEPTINSAVAQKERCSNVEIIIIDGGSKDESQQIIAKYIDQIDICLVEIDEGIYFAMNKALRLASKEYIYFLNAGDEFAEDFSFEKIPCGSDVVLAPVLCHELKPPLLFDVSYNTKSSFEERLAFGNTCSHQGFICRRSIHSSFDTKYKLDADRLVICQALDVAESVLVYSKAIAYIALPGASSAYLSMISEKIMHLRRPQVFRIKYSLFLFVIITKKLIWLALRGLRFDLANWR